MWCRDCEGVWLSDELPDRFPAICRRVNLFIQGFCFDSSFCSRHLPLGHSWGSRATRTLGRASIAKRMFYRMVTGWKTSLRINDGVPCMLPAYSIEAIS